MATTAHSVTSKGRKAGILGRNAAKGRVVMAPVATKKGTVSDKQISDAVKSVLAKKK